MPATIAVLEGVPHVGLTQEQLQHIAQRGPAVRLCFGAALCYCASVVLHLTSDASISSSTGHGHHLRNWIHAAT